MAFYQIADQVTEEEEELDSALASTLPLPPGSSDEEDDNRVEYGSTRNTELGDEFDWRTKLRTDLISQVEKWADLLNLPKFSLDAFVRDNFDTIWRYVEPDLVNREIYNDGDVMQVGKPTDPGTAEYTLAWNKALQLTAAMLGAPQILGVNPSKGGGGGGRRGPTAAEIRNAFDEDQLTNAVTSLWGAYMLEDPKDARAMARAYIEAHVQTGGKQEIDFETFIRNKMESTSRWQLLYQNKPEGVDPLKYVQPYMQAAQAAMGAGGNTTAVGTVAAGGAALGATGEQFTNRLRRTDQHTSTAGFITGLEERMRGVSNVLRG